MGGWALYIPASSVRGGWTRRLAAKKGGQSFPRLKVRLSASPLAALGLGIGHRLKIWLSDWRQIHSPTRSVPLSLLIQDSPSGWARSYWLVISHFLLGLKIFISLLPNHGTRLVGQSAILFSSASLLQPSQAHYFYPIIRVNSLFATRTRLSNGRSFLGGCPVCHGVMISDTLKSD